MASRASNPFARTQEHIDRVTETLGLEREMGDFLRWPQRELAVTLPLRMDDGSCQVHRAFRVQDSIARGPTWGGLRWHSNENLDTIRSYAMKMTFRAALLDLPIGGAFGGISCAPRDLSEPEKERLARAYVRAIHPTLGADRDVIAPDLYTNPQVMAWMLDEYETIHAQAAPGGMTGKPLPLGGSLGRGDAIGHGVVCVTRRAAQARGLPFEGGKAIVCGFARVGQSVARLLAKQGLDIVAVVDASCAIRARSGGLNIEALCDHKLTTGTVAEFQDAEECDRAEAIEEEANVLVATEPGLGLQEESAGAVRASLVCEVCDGGVDRSADDVLASRGVLLVPDILGAGGDLLVAYLEQVQNRSRLSWDVAALQTHVENSLQRALDAVLEASEVYSVPPRFAASLVAAQRVAEAARLRGWL